MTALLNDYEDFVLPEGIDILDMGWLESNGVTIVNARDIVIMPYLTLNLAKVQAPSGPLRDQQTRVPLLRTLEGTFFALGGFAILKAAFEGASSSFVQCDVYLPGGAYEDSPELHQALAAIQDGFVGEENELWSYVKVVGRNDWDVAETFRQPLRLVQTMRKALRLFEAEGTTPPACWQRTLEQIAESFPAAWDEDFAYCSEGHHLVEGTDPADYILLMSRKTAEACQQAEACQEEACEQ